MKLAMSSLFHPQTDGQTERANRTLEEMLRYSVSYRQDDWCEKLEYLEFAYNNAKNKTTGQTPFLLNYGQEPLEFSDLLLKNEPNMVPSASDVVAHMQELAQTASASIEQRNKATTAYQRAKRRDYKFGVGDEVLLSTKHLSHQRTRREGKSWLRSSLAHMKSFKLCHRLRTSWRFPRAQTLIQYSTPDY
jgi:hypothetical protein